MAQRGPRRASLAPPRYAPSVNRRRWPWILGFLAALLAALLAAGLWVGDLEAALVRDATDVVAAPRPRPSHVDRPVPGQFSDALRPAYGPFLAGFQATAAGGEAVLAGQVARGERPASDLPVALREQVLALVPLHDAVLAASRAAVADLGPDHAAFGPFAAPVGAGPQAGDSWLGIQHAARLAAIRIWLAPDATALGERLPLCLDGLALGRDAAISGGLVGTMVEASTVALLQPACGAALGALPPGQVLDALDRLRRIRDAVPHLDAMLREEMIQVRLLTYGPDLPERLRAGLPARPRAFVEDGAMRPDSAWGRAVARLAWRPLERFQARMVAAARLPAAEREAAMADADAAFTWLGWLLGLPEAPTPAQNYARYARRAEAARLRLELLAAAAAARQFRNQGGAWPERIAELGAAGLLRGDEAARVAGAVLLVEDRGATLRLILPLPRHLVGS